MLRLNESEVISTTVVGLKITRFALDMERETIRVDYVTLNENEEGVERKSIRVRGDDFQTLMGANGDCFVSIKQALYTKLSEDLELSGSVE